jgi:hypothetical protein
VYTGPRGETVFTDSAVSIPVDLRDVKSLEGDEVRLRVWLSVRIPASDADRRVLRQTLLAGRAVLNPGDVAEALRPRLQAAAQSLGLSSEQWFPPPAASVEIMHRAAATATYVVGLELEPASLRLEAEVPAYQLRVSEQRRNQFRQSEEQRRLESAKRVADVLQDLREKNLPLSDVLAQLPPEEAQSLLLSTLGQSPVAPARVYCVAAQALVELVASESRSAGARWETVVRQLPTDLGPLRSVFASSGAAELLIGARDGLMLVTPNATTLYRDQPLATEHGFSILARHGRYLFGAHRQRGLVWWDVDLPDQPVSALRPPVATAPTISPPRLPTAVSQATLSPTPGGAAAPGQYSAMLPWNDDSLLVASSALELLRPDGSLTRLAALSSRTLLLAESDGRVAAVGEDGCVRLFDALDLRPAGEIRLGEPLVSAGLLPFSGGTRLLCAASGGAVISCGVSDPVVLRYSSAHRGLREVAGGPGLVAAVSPDRMRAILWDAWEPRRPATEVHIGAVVRGRIADLTVI